MNPKSLVAGEGYASRPGEISRSLPIPEYKIGWIIGKRGSYINQLAKKSGASISISETTSKEYGTVWKYVQLRGTGRAIDRAKKLLHIRLERLEPRPVVEGSGDPSKMFDGYDENDDEYHETTGDGNGDESRNQQSFPYDAPGPSEQKFFGHPEIQTQEYDTTPNTVTTNDHHPTDPTAVETSNHQSINGT